MSTRVAERLDDWDSRSFTGGFHELEDLADGEFSGIVRAGGAELYITTGTVVGVERGSIEDFADATGTVFEAPSPALPLLAVMQEADADVRAKYYSEDTPMSEVDRTLSDGSFTGYVELSDNVLSGDYYLVYHGGRSMAVGFVGNSAKLITDDEAFETANDEVGIYKVRQVDVDPIEIPAAEGDRSAAAEGDRSAAAEDDRSVAGEGAGGTEAAAAAAGNAGGSAATPEPDAEAEFEEESAPADAGSASESTLSAEDPGEGGAEGSTEAEATAATESEATGEANQAEAGAGAESGGSGRAESGTGTSAGETTAAGTSSVSTDSTPGSQEREAGEGATGEPDGPGAGGSPSTEPTGSQPAPERGSQSPRGGSSSGGRSGGSIGSSPGFDEGSAPGGTAGGSATDLETRSIPSLDPERTMTPRRSGGAAGGARGDAPARGRSGGGDAGVTQQPASGAGARSGSSPESRGDETGRDADSPSKGGRESGGTGSGADAARGGVPAEGAAEERYEELQSELSDRETEVERLESELDRVKTEREDLKDQLERVREERDELAEKVDRLESELTRLEEELGAATDAERRLTAREALDGTDVFVRYHSKGDATLKKAHDGSVRREDVTDNLRLEKHTQFDASKVAVGGKNYPEFIEARPEYQFVRWTVEELLFEIRDTGHAEALQVLFDALPKVDRGELNGVIDVTFTDEGQETRTQETFDVILRDRMGNPLLVANLNDSREGATESMMSNLITAAERVGQTTDTMAGAFLVTRSFFEPDALETAEEATRSGILSRDKRRSFVNISRKRGFHLCLVEARNQNFHLAVPEL